MIVSDFGIVFRDSVTSTGLFKKGANMLCNVNGKKILCLFVAQLILFSLGLATSARAAEPIQPCRNGATRGCAIKGMPGQQYCDGGVWSACAPLPPTLPNPILELTGKEDYQANGQNWTRYKLAVKNHAAYPNAMFAPAPNLPPCGANKNSSRTWVNIYHYVALKTPPQYIYGFCALSSSNDLVNLWFASPAGKAPPSPVIVVLEDRQTKKNYISNTVAIAPMPGLSNQPKVANPSAG